MRNLPYWKLLARHLRVWRRARLPSIDGRRILCNDFEEDFTEGDSAEYEISKDEEIWPDPKTPPERGTSTGILDLPRELRDHLISYLSPSSAVALKLSCRTLYHSGPALPVLSYLARKTPESRYEWTLMQERLGRCTGKLACSGCRTLHDVSLFASKEREKKAEYRLCAGRHRVLYLTPDRFLPFCHFEQICYYLLRDPRYLTYAYGWFCYHYDGELFELPPSSGDVGRFPLHGHYHWTKRSKGMISLASYLTIRLESVDPAAQSCRSISSELQKFPFTLCRHITSATHGIAKAIHEAQRLRMCKSKKRRRVYLNCSYCDCKPRVEINNACKAVIIYARRSVGKGSPTDPAWLEQTESIAPVYLQDSNCSAETTNTEIATFIGV